MRPRSARSTCPCDSPPNMMGWTVHGRPTLVDPKIGELRKFTVHQSYGEMARKWFPIYIYNHLNRSK